MPGMSWTEISFLTVDSIEKKYYKISEVSEILGLPMSTLRFWESKFSIIRPRRNAGGSRFYTPADIEKIRLVHYLVKEKKLKIEAVQEQLRINSTGLSRRHEAIERLKAVRERLVSLLDNLNKIH